MAKSSMKIAVLCCARVWRSAVCERSALARKRAFPCGPCVYRPFTQGAGTEIVAAQCGAPDDSWRQPVMSEPPGAGGTIAGELVAKANATVHDSCSAT